MAEPNAYYAIQPAFTAGEISAEVASRVDLDKYQLALLQAENAVIRPYGPVKKRTGFIYCGNIKSTSGNVLLKEFEFASSVNYLLEFGEKYVRIWRDGIYLDVELVTPYPASVLKKLRFVQSVDVMYITSGDYPVYKLMRYSETNWAMQTASWTLQPYGDINLDEDLTITPSAASGEITLTASKDLFAAEDIGDSIKIEQVVSGTEATASSSGTYATVRVGESWKIISHGTWAGSLYVEQSLDGGTTWTNLRTYSSDSDYNPTESGDVDEPCMLRAYAVLTSGSCNISLYAYPYTNTGYVTITGVTSSTVATGTVTKELGNTSATADWYWAAWSEKNGYPNCATFFQDRLCLGGNDAYPTRVWMSRSGDYENFEVDKEDGTVTDDSAISADFMSRQAYTISHMDAGTDMLIFTEGNMWTVSGSEVVTPSNITPRNQESYGISDIAPIKVGGRTVYVQNRGSIIRDTGYSYDTDGYVGQDLTLLAKHLIREREIEAAAYAQEPDSMLYFVTSEGDIICLTYIVSQKVYAWSRFVTDGTFLSVCSAGTGNNDLVYAAVEREINGEKVRYLEQLAIDTESAHQQDHIMLDSAKIITNSTAAAEITGLSHLEGKEIYVLGDGYLFEKLTVKDGAVTLPQKVKEATAGLPYTMILEQPDFDIGNTQTGTVQGRRKTVTSAILRLTKSFGGSIGPDEDNQNDIIYDSERMEVGGDGTEGEDAILYSGDKSVILAAGGFNVRGRTYIIHETPYPFNLSAIIREVTFGG